MKRTFLLYTSDRSQVELLTNEEAGILFKALFDYAEKGQELVTNNRTLAVVFAMFKGKLEIDSERYKDIVEKRREAGRRGNEVRWGSQKSQMLANAINVSQKSQMLANVADNDNVNDNVNDNNKVKSNSNKREAKKVNAADAAALTQKRKDAFYNSLVPYVGQYPAEMVREFFEYWTEPNKSQTKMRFELQPTWEAGRRLAMWARREKMSNKSNTRDNGRQERIDEAAALVGSLLSGAN